MGWKNGDSNNRATLNIANGCFAESSTIVVLRHVSSQLYTSDPLQIPFKLRTFLLFGRFTWLLFGIHAVFKSHAKTFANCVPILRLSLVFLGFFVRFPAFRDFSQCFLCANKALLRTTIRIHAKTTNEYTSHTRHNSNGPHQNTHRSQCMKHKRLIRRSKQRYQRYAVN